MDAGQILVAVLTSAAVGWLIWVEMHSRRNAAAQSASQSPKAAESDASEERVPSAQQASPEERQGQRSLGIGMAVTVPEPRSSKEM